MQKILLFFIILSASSRLVVKRLADHNSGFFLPISSASFIVAIESPIASCALKSVIPFSGAT